MKKDIINNLTEQHLLSFYGWWQLVVCLFAFAALMGIWWHIGRKLNEFGQVWLALSVLCWAFSGGIEVHYANSNKDKIENIILSNSDKINFLSDKEFTNSSNESLNNKKETVFLNGWRSIFSLFNSLFILLSLPYFRYIPGKIQNIVKSNFWLHIIGIPFLFSLLPTITRMISQNNLGMMNELDVYYGMFTIIFMSYVLFESFTKRNLKILAWLSLICCVITLMAQVYKLTSLNVNLTLYSAIFKTSLIMIFFALALSWVKELTENVIPTSVNLSLAFTKIRKNNKIEHNVILKGIGENQEQKVICTPALFDLMLRFAQRKKEGEGWLEIKPKNDIYPNKDYDIRDHNEIRRLVTTLLDGVFGKGLWTKSKHEEPFKNSLFEISKEKTRNIRLSIPKENIEVD